MKIKDVFKKLCNFLCILFFIALFIGLAGNISSKFDKVYDLIKFKSYVILSDSMKPAMDPGDVIFIKKIFFLSYQVVNFQPVTAANPHISLVIFKETMDY